MPKLACLPARESSPALLFGHGFAVVVVEGAAVVMVCPAEVAVEEAAVVVVVSPEPEVVAVVDAVVVVVGAIPSL